MRQRPPGSMFVGEDVDDLLFELIGGDAVAVFSSADEVITHLLLLSPVYSVLRAVRLENEMEWRVLALLETFILCNMNIYHTVISLL